ncbi:MAG: 30S ribosomal protein S18 [Candidatus Scalinduaceae bacterium]
MKRNKKRKLVQAKNRYSEQTKKKYAEFTTKCRFCRRRIEDIDYKDTQYLQKLIGGQGRLLSKKRSGNCTAHQGLVKVALKRARYMALLPYTA